MVWQGFGSTLHQDRNKSSRDKHREYMVYPLKREKERIEEEKGETGREAKKSQESQMTYFNFQHNSCNFKN